MVVVRSGADFRVMTVGSWGAGVEGSSVSTGPGAPVQVMDAWLETVVPSSRGFTTSAWRCKVAWAPGARAPTCQVTVCPLTVPPSAGARPVSRAETGSVTVTAGAVWVPVFFTVTT